jgi:hypothetical protein
LQILSERGYLILAVNTVEVDYIACAIKLAKSIKQWHPDAKVCLVTDKEFRHEVFDHVKLLPFGDSDPDSKWKLSNDWQAYLCSPFRQTIKLEADMFVASPIDHWWTLFEKKDVVISVGCRDIYNRTATSRYYRKQFDLNDLPDVYNAITYWRLSYTAKSFFLLVKDIFINWQVYRSLLKFSDDYPTTDVVYAMAAKITGVENCTLPPDIGPTMVHMKRHIIPISGQDWTKELVWEYTNPGLRINTVAQLGLVHYHVKEWAHE